MAIIIHFTKLMHLGFIAKNFQNNFHINIYFWNKTRWKIWCTSECMCMSKASASDLETWKIRNYYVGLLFLGKFWYIWLSATTFPVLILFLNYKVNQIKSEHCLKLFSGSFLTFCHLIKCSGKNAWWKKVPLKTSLSWQQANGEYSFVDVLKFWTLNADVLDKNIHFVRSHVRVLYSFEKHKFKSKGESEMLDDRHKYRQ